MDHNVDALVGVVHGIQTHCRYAMVDDGVVRLHPHPP